MTKSEFLREIELTLDLKPNTIKYEDVLDDIGWDSLSATVFIVEVEQHFQVSLTIDQLRKCKIVKDLFDLLNGKFSDE
jgi:acyl carrier protein